jgi:hypothetical protein
MMLTVNLGVEFIGFRGWGFEWLKTLTFHYEDVGSTLEKERFFLDKELSSVYDFM